ncbi:DUF4352 domain-containing protein [Streptosporangium sp. NPDC051022]|uniref:DUF4352 domain-containing protein n=1 Tax=Streptosporangium sp. NPDC051022 TaxID=3155752 RepID=UPI00343D6264
MTNPPYGQQPPRRPHQQRPYGHPTQPYQRRDGFHQGPPAGYPQPQPYPPRYPRHDYDYGYPPPPRTGAGAIIGIVAGVSLLLVLGVIATLSAVSTIPTAGDELLRSTPDQVRSSASAPELALENVQPTPATVSAQPPATLPAQPPATVPAQSPAAVAAQPSAPAFQRQAGQAGTTAAKVGETITVNGLNAGTKIAVTLNRVIGRGTAANQFLTAKPGKRLAAVELTIKNVGTSVYDDSPIMGATIIDAEGQQYRTTLADVTEEIPLGGSVTIAVGDSRKGVIVFEVPETAVLTKLQFGPALSPQKGEWLLS